MWCIVNLPNGTQQAVKCDRGAIGQECLEKVCKALNIICEMEYFGLEHWTLNDEKKETRTPRHWINLRNRLSQDGGSGSNIQLTLALRVKFWVPVHLILQESVRNIFYMQAKVDLLEGRLNAKDWDSAARLGALLCQADGIRFNDVCLAAKCPIRVKHDSKEKKEKEHALAFKKRRLSKQKSMESFDLPSLPLPTDSTTSASSATSTSSQSDVEVSPLQIYEDYVIRPNDLETDIPEQFLKLIAKEHGKLSKLKMSSKSAKYWLLKEIQELQGFGEEIFNGVTATDNTTVRCEIAVGANGLSVFTGDEKYSIPFSAIAAAKSFRRTFKLEYVDDQNERRELDIKLPKHAIAAGLYRSITERHAFYVCDKVRVVVTSQFTRDLKGTIASMFKEDTELGKRYVFDIQRTCREVHDQARRILYERGIEVNCSSDDIERYLPSVELVDCNAVEEAIKAKQDREAVIERCVDSRISEAMTCKICMDNEINTMFNPCGHVTACAFCAAKCDRCPNCRVKTQSVVKVFLPSELRTNAASTICSTKNAPNRMTKLIATT